MDETLRIVDVWLAPLSRIVLIIGLFFTARQIRNSIRIHTENLDWNRRKAAQDALLSNNQNELVKSLRTAFDYNNIKEAVPLTLIHAQFKENPELQNVIQRLLDVHESFARGILQNIYDEEVIYTARKNSMIRAWDIFKLYIDYRRKQINPLAWSDLESLVNQWRHLDTVKNKREGSLFEKRRRRRAVSFLKNP